MLGRVDFLFPALLAIFGLLIGSFLNVCIYRIIRDQSVVTPRSFCPKCGQFIVWYDNIPVISFVLLQGRCRFCGQPISLRYPAVELMTSLVFCLIGARYGMHLWALKWCLFESLMIVLGFTDLEERLLPDELTLGGTVAGLLLALWLPMPGVLCEILLPKAKPRLQSLFEVVASAALLTLPIWGFGTFWGRIRRKEMLGLGDVKLLPLIAVFLGLEKGISALLIGSIAGVIIGGSYIYFTRQQPGSYELPLGTFLCAGAGLIPLLTTVLYG